jgi:nicotinamide-nucleotide amidase
MQNGHSSECYPANLDKTVTSVVELLKNRGLTISSAESCTGGMFSELITSVPGASDVFELGICTYSARMKEKFLNIPENIIDCYGVVSAETAMSMVKGLKECSGADVCVSFTGIAGPGGGTDDCPVGTVYIAFDVCGEQAVRKPTFPDVESMSRDDVRRAACGYALKFILETLVEVIQFDGR